MGEPGVLEPAAKREKGPPIAKGQSELTAQAGGCEGGDPGCSSGASQWVLCGPCITFISMCLV